MPYFDHLNNQQDIFTNVGSKEANNKKVGRSSLSNEGNVGRAPNIKGLRAASFFPLKPHHHLFPLQKRDGLSYEPDVSAF